jgi:CBS domain containing-hemolysin-like protein
VDSLLAVAVIAALIVLNGLFVAAEFAIVAAPRMALEQRAQSGHRVAAAVTAILSDPRRQDQFIASAQVGITLASLALGMYGEHVVAAWFAAAFEGLGAHRYIAAHGVASVLSVVVLTYFHIVVGEMVPKSLALQQAERTVLWVAPLMRIIRLCFHPLVLGLNVVGNGILALLGMSRQAPSHERYYSPEELQLVVQESADAGVLPSEARTLVSGIFEFGERTAGEVMVPRVRVTGLRVGVSPEEVEDVLRRWPKARYPVYEGDVDHILGVVHVKDLLRLIVAGAPLTADVARPMPVVPEGAPLDQVLSTMRTERTHMALVVDEYGGVAGIVTLEDLVEEVVGEIGDDEDDAWDIRTDESGIVRVQGTVRLGELGQRLGSSLDHPEVDSVSGLVLALLGRPARVGDAVTFAGYRFEVMGLHGFGVAECAVRPIAGGSEQMKNDERERPD